MHVRRPRSSWFWALAAVIVAGAGVMFLVHTLANRRADKNRLSWSGITTGIAQRYPDVQHLAPAELAAWLTDPARIRPLIIDVRARAEFDVSHLPEAIHAGSAENVVELVRASPANRPIVVYCSVGWRSAIVADAVRQSGPANIWNLRGSIFQWANEGRPLEREGAPVRVVHPYDEQWGALLNRDLWPPDFAR